MFSDAERFEEYLRHFFIVVAHSSGITVSSIHLLYLGRILLPCFNV